MPFYLTPDVINWLVSAPKSNYVHIYDVKYKFMLFADDVEPQQDPESQRMSHILAKCSNQPLTFYRFSSKPIRAVAQQRSSPELSFAN